MSDAVHVLGQELTLPCGVTIKNRFLKSAMSETLSSIDHRPTTQLAHLYRIWAEGGAGLVVTGNVMVDGKALGEPRNVVLEDKRALADFKTWAQAGTYNGTHLWMQLNHPGKQSPKFFSKETVAPSAIPFSANLQSTFTTPRALTEREIVDLIARFARAAELAKQAGFTGVQIHGAHGYLVSQFLSPLHNQRSDQWGGTLANRMRFVLEIYQAMRAQVGSSFPLGIKLNSADFMRGGFSEEESMEVVQRLAESGIDLIEISGGTYESPQMTGQNLRESTRQREAYFLAYAEKVRKLVSTPLVVTGGFRTPEGMSAAVSSGDTDMIGLARPLALQPDLPARILRGEQVVSPVRAIRSGFKTLDSLLEITWYEQQLKRIAQGKAPDPTHNTWASLAETVLTQGFQAFQQRRAK